MGKQMLEPALVCIGSSAFATSLRVTIVRKDEG